MSDQLLEGRWVTGDSSVRGGLLFQKPGERARPLEFQASTGGSKLKINALRGAGALNELYHIFTPWSGTLWQSPRSTLSAFANNPAKTSSFLMGTVIAPAFVSYFWNRHHGPEYINFDMDGRTDQDSNNYMYFAVPGRPPEEGVRVPMPQEVNVVWRGVKKFLDLMVNRSPHTIAEEATDLLNGFLETNIIPPVPPIVSTPLAYFGVTLPGGFMSRAYTPQTNDFRFYRQSEDTLERMLRAGGPWLARYYSEYYTVAHASQGGRFQQATEGLGSVIKDVGRRSFLGPQVLGITPDRTANNRIKQEVFQARETIAQVAKFQAESAETMSVKPRSGEGRQILEQAMPNEMLSKKDTEIKVIGTPQKPATNPLYAATMETIKTLFKKDMIVARDEESGEVLSGAYPSMWQEYTRYGKMINSMRNVSDGNTRAWIADQKNENGEPTWDDHILDRMEAAKVDTNNYREVRNFMIGQQDKIANRIHSYIKHAEDIIDKDETVRQLLGPLHFRLSMVHPYKPGIDLMQAEEDVIAGEKEGAQ
jgi:hypothetical protein